MLEESELSSTGFTALEPLELLVCDYHFLKERSVELQQKKIEKMEAEALKKSVTRRLVF
jgi:hypothetical protein